MAIEQVVAVIAATVVPQTVVVTPADVAVPPPVQNVVVPEYDFLAQQRWIGSEIKVAGNFTMGSRQSFDSNGRPYDNAGDNND